MFSLKSIYRIAPYVVFLMYRIWQAEAKFTSDLQLQKMEKFTLFSEKFGKLPRIVKVAGGLATLAAVAKINYELNPKPEVTVLNLHGTIVAGRAGLNGQPPINMENLRKKIDFAFKPKRLQYVLLNINSPGGSPVQCDLISSYIKKKSEEKGVPVIAFVEDVAASGG